ncbi:unnamed protein product [Ectocarpus sp. 6 AP-2014]
MGFLGLKEAFQGQVQLFFGCLGGLAARFGVRTPVEHAMFGGYISVLTGATEFVLSIIAGEDEDSSSLLGISIMAFAEIVGSLLVLWRWRKGMGNDRGGASHRKSEQLQEDAKCSLCVGLISLAVVAALVLERLVSWADSATGICLSLYIVYEGVMSVWEARQQFVAHLEGDEGLRLVPLMHERLLLDKEEGTALLEETM